ncbi:UNVERIFIED_CONTAM: hypothetical protein GTU68_058123 [Idotea baltica]|nr:hypothetical protein [Idotea baltica]
MTFADLNLSKPLLNAVNELGLEHPTAIQEKAFSPIMAGRDVVGIAQTGTGKTFAYLLPVLRLWKFVRSPFPQILIIVPTRELVAQVVEEVEKLTTYMNVVAVGVYGGTNMRTQKAHIERGVDVVVGTPGRLVDLFLEWEEKVGVIHSSKAQNNRFATVKKFQDGTYRFIIATDLIARGLDITGVTHIVNFDLTDTAEQYIHRIGRTGRAEEQGVAISFISEKDAKYKEPIEMLMDKTIEIKPLPAEDLITDDLIDLEKEVDFVPFNNHKMKAHEPSGPAFHEKAERNKKVNNKIRRAEQMKLKYKKPKKRGMKQKKKK